MNSYHDLSGLVLLSAVFTAVMVVYLTAGLIGVAVAAALTDLVLRRIETRRANALAQARSAGRRNSP